MQVSLPFGLFDSVARAIGKVFDWIFQNVLGPVLEIAFTNVVQPIFFVLLDLLHLLLIDVFYFLLSYLLRILDVVERAFNMFAGIETVSYRASASAAYTESYLLNVLFGQNSISRAFQGITLIAMILAAFFTFLSLVKSMGDMEGKRPVGKILGSCGKTMLTFFIVPFVAIVSINLSSTVLKATSDAIKTSSGTDGGTIGTQIFLAVSLDSLESETAKENARLAFTKGYNGQVLKYYEKEDVLRIFDSLENLNLEIGIVATLIIFIMMVIACFLFIRRIFEIIILYLVSPFFVSSMPLDDGQKFKQWRELFLSKLISGYGIVIAMNLYLLLIPLFMSSNLVFFKNDRLANMVMQLLFLLGGSYSVLMSHTLLLQVFNPQAAMQEAQSGMMGQSLATSALSMGAGFMMGAGSAVWGGAKKAGGLAGMLGVQTAKQSYAARKLMKAGKSSRAVGGGAGALSGDASAPSFNDFVKASAGSSMARKTTSGASFTGLAKGGYQGYKDMKNTKMPSVKDIIKNSGPQQGQKDPASRRSATSRHGASFTSLGKDAYAAYKELKNTKMPSIKDLIKSSGGTQAPKKYSNVLGSTAKSKGETTAAATKSSMTPKMSAYSDASGGQSSGQDTRAPSSYNSGETRRHSYSDSQSGGKGSVSAHINVRVSSEAPVRAIGIRAKKSPPKK